MHDEQLDSVFDEQVPEADDVPGQQHLQLTLVAVAMSRQTNRQVKRKDAIVAADRLKCVRQ